jgi:Leucine-rich repeat (LRR) protein
MAHFNDLPDKIVLKIFSYLNLTQLVLCVKNVCKRWRALSENDEIWKDSRFYPDANSPVEYIIFTVTAAKPLRRFQYYGSCNVLEILSQCCRRIKYLTIPCIELSATLIKVVMERLTELKSLHITIGQTDEGLRITSIVGKSETLVHLSLYSSNEVTVRSGLLKPIADGCPNLKTLRCEAFNLPNSEICYLMQCKKQQLETYDHYGLVSADFLRALNECTKLRRVSFQSVEFDGPYNEMPPTTNLKNLTSLEVMVCKLPMVKIIPLTLFLDTLSHLASIALTYSFTNIDELVNKIILQCPALTKLDLEGNSELRCRSLRNISSCKEIRYLDVSICKKLEKKAMKYVADGCPKLHTLEVSGIPITDIMFRQILRCKNLKNLLMANCELTGIDFKLISTNIPDLRNLLIGPNFQLPHEVEREMKRRMPKLKITTASEGCNKAEHLQIKINCITDCSGKEKIKFSSMKNV